MGLKKFSEFKANRTAVREAKGKELANTKFNETFKKKLEEMGVTSVKDLTEEQLVALMDSLKPTKKNKTEEKVEVEIEIDDKEDDDEEESVEESNVAPGIKAMAAKARADKKKSSVKEMMEAMHEMAMAYDESDDEKETYETYIKECSEMMKEMKKDVSESEVNEAKIDNEEEFRAYGEKFLKKAFGDKYDDAKAKSTISGIIKKSDGDWGAAVGILQNSASN